MKARLPEGYGGGPGNMQSMIRKAQKMQEEMAKLQHELEEREFEATSGGGAVSVKMLGKRELTSVVIDKEVIDPEDKEMLEDLVMAAVNGVLAEIEKVSSEEMGKVTGSFSIPGMPGLF